MRKTIRALALLGAVLLVLGVGVAAIAANSGPSPSPTAVTTTDLPTPEESAAPSFDDVKGNCDEVEHADDPGCQGIQTPDEGSVAGRNETDDDEDRSGPSANSGPASLDDDTEDEADHEDEDDSAEHDDSGHDGSHDDSGQDGSHDDSGHDEED
jgi:hypothetical protein